MSRFLPSCLVALLLALPAGAGAHSKTSSTHPEDGATLEAVPETLRVTFDAPARVVKVVVSHTGPGGTSETRLPLPSREPLEELRLEPELPGAGDYSIAWRALGSDGHVMRGSFAFTVR